MDVAALVALLYRGAGAEHRLSADLVIRRDPEAERRLTDLGNRAVRAMVSRSGSYLPEAMAEPAETEAEEAIELTAAPAGRYRFERPARAELLLGDGAVHWSRTGDRGARSGYGPPHDAPALLMLVPTWLLTGHQVSGVQPTTESGRPAVRFRATPRRGGPTLTSRARQYGIEYLDAVADAEHGVLLSLTEVFEGRPVRTLRLMDHQFDGPEPDACRFTLPDVATVGGPDAGAWAPPPQAMAEGARSGLLLLARVALDRGYRQGFRAAMDPQDGGPWPDRLDPTVVPSEDEPPSVAELALLLYRAGLEGRAVAAELHHWIDYRALAGAAEPDLPGPDGSVGPDGSDSEGGQDGPGGPRTGYRTVRFLVRDPEHYRVEQLRGADPTTAPLVARDGARQYRRFPDRLVLAEADALESQVDRMVDPSWLLGAELTPLGFADCAGRRVIRARAVRRRWSVPGHETVYSERTELLIDAGTGVLLSLTGLEGDRIGQRQLLCDLSFPDSVDPGEFVLTAPPGTPTVAFSGGPLGDAVLPKPVKSAVETAAQVLSGVVSCVVAAGIRFGERRERAAEAAERPADPPREA
ncbi:hypothetical protein [Streptacidiphilus carbonis]|uniref:hypothetical protein n=1 Tax=Streptacidiphilus carbonis TaxID=105422 RepID=UPI0005AB4710|nr:hypothetical protein [Streptacidiphilus carbonis]